MSAAAAPGNAPGDAAVAAAAGSAAAGTASAPSPFAVTIDCDAWAADLGVSREACELVAANDIVDWHLDTFIWTRILGYSPDHRHGNGVLDARFLHQADLPRMADGHITSAIWSITTNPFRPQRSRPGTFVKNLNRLRALLAASPYADVVTNIRDYRATRAAGRHAAWIGVQGANALDVDPGFVAAYAAPWLVKATLVHLTTSSLGATSAPDPLRRGRPGGLTERGRKMVAALDDARILVDLAHIHPDGFWDAVEVHDASLPLIVSHTGVDGATLHWRNLDDDQLHAVARTDGLVGIMYQCSFVGAAAWGEPAADKLFAHFAHAVDVIGDEHVALGSDWDGAIVTPRDMKTVTGLPVLVQRMLDAGWNEGRIGRILGGNAERVLATIRP